MSVLDTQNSILFGGAALAEFMQEIKSASHPQPAVLAERAFDLASQTIQQLSPSSPALPYLALGATLLSMFFPAPAPATTPAVPTA